MSWWAKATTEQKLAQLDGGIECGLTAAQIAMIVGTARWNVSSFARYHSRRIFESDRHRYDHSHIGAVFDRGQINPRLR